MRQSTTSPMPPSSDPVRAAALARTRAAECAWLVEGGPRVNPTDFNPCAAVEFPTGRLLRCAQARKASIPSAAVASAA